jgi:hypothetical protein
MVAFGNQNECWNKSSTDYFMKQPMRSLRFLICTFVLLVSCSRNELPVIGDADLLHKECADLYEQFPTNDVASTNYNPELGMKAIPEEKWSPSIKALNPHGVIRNKYGVVILIKSQRPRNLDDWVVKGYYVLVKQAQDPFPGKITPLSRKPSLFRYNPTDYKDIYEIEQPAGHI